MHAPYNPLPPSEERLSALPSVLVIDDEVRSVEALERILEDDFDVKKATSIEEAEAIQVVLCDQRMPGMSGGRVSESRARALARCRPHDHLGLYRRRGYHSGRQRGRDLSICHRALAAG
jgi:PleD family two-component response regulator